MPKNPEEEMSLLRIRDRDRDLPTVTLAQIVGSDFHY